MLETQSPSKPGLASCGMLLLNNYGLRNPTVTCPPATGRLRQPDGISGLTGAAVSLCIPKKTGSNWPTEHCKCLPESFCLTTSVIFSGAGKHHRALSLLLRSSQKKKKKAGSPAATWAAAHRGRRLSLVNATSNKPLNACMNANLCHSRCKGHLTYSREGFRRATSCC